MNKKKYRHLTELTVKNIVRRKLRSILTIISVVIGIATIVSLFLISDGLFNYVNSEFEKMGVNTIFLLPMSYSGGPNTIAGRVSEDIKLKEKDIRIIEKISEVEYAIGFTYRTGKIEYKNEDEFQFVMMTDADKMEQMLEVMDMSLREGKIIPNKESKNVIVGSYFADNLFSKPINIGDRISLEDQDLRVVGILDPIGNVQDDSSIFISSNLGKEIYDIKDTLDTIYVRVKIENNPEEVKEIIEKRLDKEYGKDKFFIITATQVLSLIRTIINLLQMVLVSIGLISILVGSVGIINSIYTSVIERTKEIGILKSLGAKKEDIYYIFTSESIILTIIGGFLGLGLGILIAKAVEWYASNQGFLTLKIIITWEIVLLALGISLIVGIIAGILPSNKASKLNVVEALKKIV